MLIWWALAFICLALITKDEAISKYGSFFLFMVSIPIYGYLAIKNASKLKATIDTEELKSNDATPISKGLKRYVTKFDLWFAGILIIGIPLYLFVGNFIFGLELDRLEDHIAILILFAILVELILRKKHIKK